MDKELKNEFTILSKKITTLTVATTKGFKVLGARVESLTGRIGVVEGRINVVEGKFDEMFEAIGHFSNQVDHRFNAIEAKISNLPDKEYISEKLAVLANANKLILHEDSPIYKPSRGKRKQ